jgi:uncharacterized membrane protein YhiD involved in acid resistance
MQFVVFFLDRIYMLMMDVCVMSCLSSGIGLDIGSGNLDNPIINLLTIIITVSGLATFSVQCARRDDSPVYKES